jgi:hypothetical protein
MLQLIGRALTVLLERCGFGRLLGWSKMKSYILAFFAGVAGSVAEGIIEAVKEFFEAEGVRGYLSDWIFEKSGLIVDLERYNDAEMWKEAIGRRAAELVNAKLGTQIDTMYPVEQFKTEIKNEFLAEIQSGTHKFLSNEDIQSLMQGLDNLRANASGLNVVAGGINIAITNDVIAHQLAYKRAQGRERSRRYALTHKRVSYSWEPKQ